jgi:hypothetical protein
MSLVSIAQSLAKEYSPAVELMVWIIDQIEMRKFTERVMEATNFPNEVRKCVLLEYNYTPWKYVEKGLPDISDRMPGTDNLVHSMFHAPALKCIQKYICGDYPHARVYVRRKINREENKPCPHRWQLVVVFNDKPIIEDVSSVGNDKSDIHSLD